MSMIAFIQAGSTEVDSTKIFTTWFHAGGLDVPGVKTVNIWLVPPQYTLDLSPKTQDSSGKWRFIGIHPFLYAGYNPVILIIDPKFLGRLKLL